MKIFSFFLCINFFPLVAMQASKSQENNNSGSLIVDRKPSNPIFKRVRKQSLTEEGLPSLPIVDGKVIPSQRLAENQSKI